MRRGVVVVESDDGDEAFWRDRGGIGVDAAEERGGDGQRREDPVDEQVVGVRHDDGLQTPFRGRDQINDPAHPRSDRDAPQRPSDGFRAVAQLVEAPQHGVDRGDPREAV